MSTFDQILNGLQDKISDFTEIRVITAVGDFVYSETTVETGEGINKEKRTVINVEQRSGSTSNSAAESRINILDGDIITKLGTSFYGEKSTELRQYHEQQVKNGKDTINGTIESAKSLVKFIKEEIGSRTNNTNINQNEGS